MTPPIPQPQIYHIIKIASEDSVGYGSDFDGIEHVPVGLSDVRRAVARAGVIAGWSFLVNVLYGASYRLFCLV